MNRQDVQALLALNKSNYPSAYREMTKPEVEALLKSWLSALEPYPPELVQAAYLRALTRCRFPVTLADIFDELRAVKNAGRPSVEALWRELTAVADYCADRAWRFDFNGPGELPGMTQGDCERNRCMERMRGMSAENRDFIGNLSRLISFGRMDRQEREGLHFGRYRRFIEDWRLREETLQALPEAMRKYLPVGE